MRYFDLTSDAGPDPQAQTEGREGRVYAVHPVKDDVSAAEQFGEIRYINHRYVYPDELSPDGDLPPKVIAEIRNAAQEFDPETDYVLIVGDHVQVASFIHTLAMFQKDVSVLRYDRQANGYVPVKI